jgi:histidine triad (HIT) family protein
MYLVANRLAEEEGLAERGYRMIINCGDEAGQTVHHLHMHLLGGRVLTWTA